jgi:predicted ATPase
LGRQARGAARVIAPEIRGSPFLTHVSLHPDRVQPEVHPFELPVVREGFPMSFTTPVTFIVGENGSGKSTLLEALAWAVGFGAHGGNRDHQFVEGSEGHALGRALKLVWRQRTVEGFFLRAETFYDFSAYLESVGSTFNSYGGAPLNTKSHGEAFLALFEHRFEDGLFILDEPEAALSPQRQLALLSILHRLSTPRIAQFIIATHSPMLLAFPGATVLSLEEGKLTPVDYRETNHYQLTRGFLEAPERYFRYLFDDGEP